MSGLFDRIQKQIESREQEGGISPIDLISLPPTLRRVMRILLRKSQMTYPALSEAIAASPKENRLNQAELDEALDELTKQGWLIRMGEDLITYKVNLRRKAGSNLGSGLWGAIDSKIDEFMAEEKDEDEDDEQGDGGGETAG